MVALATVSPLFANPTGLEYTPPAAPAPPDAAGLVLRLAALTAGARLASRQLAAV